VPREEIAKELWDLGQPDDFENGKDQVHCVAIKYGGLYDFDCDFTNIVFCEKENFD